VKLRLREKLEPSSGNQVFRKMDGVANFKIDVANGSK